jgi:hypothetical protein
VHHASTVLSFGIGLRVAKAAFLARFNPSSIFTPPLL